MRNPLVALLAIILTNFSLLPGLAPAQAEERTLKLSLDDVRQKALQSSNPLGAARLDREAASLRSGAQRSYFFPKIALDATERYVSVIPSLNVIPGRSIPFGDNQNNTIGVGLTWTLWDSGAIYHSWKGAEAVEIQKKHEVRNTELQTTLVASLAYFKVLLASAQLKSVTETLALARAQYSDIAARFKSGAASKVDALSASREVLDFESRVLQAKSELSRALHELLALTGETGRYDLSDPATTALPAGSIQKASLVIDPEPLSAALAAFDETQLINNRPSADHPRIAALAQQITSLNLAADSVSAGHWPKIQLAARTSLDYPNGPNLEQIHQNTIGATLTWSLFEGSRVSKEAAEKRMQADASDHRKEQARIELLRDWSDSRDQLRMLHEQQLINDSSIRESGQIAELAYSSYKLGRMNLIDVQNANLRALNVKIQAAKTDIQILIQLALLNSFVEGAQK